MADVTGDADADLTVSAELRNSTTDNYVRGITKAGDGTVAGSTDLSGWTINNAPELTSVKVVLVDKQVVLNVHRGTLIKIL